MGAGHANFSSQARDDHAEDQGCDPGEHRAGLDLGGTLRHFRADGLEMAQARQRAWSEPYGAQAPDHAHAGEGGRCGVFAQGPCSCHSTTCLP
jgi:hypothetical protein